MNSKSPNRSCDPIPGPGHYNPLQIVTEKRELLAKINPHHKDPSLNTIVPGPGHYEPSDSQTRLKSPAYGYLGG